VRTWRLDRREIAGSLGDLGTLLPIAMGLVLVTKLDATAVFFCAGAYYILSGLYFRTVIPVQPMKVIGAYAIAQALEPAVISMAGLWMGLLLLLLSLTGAVTAMGRLVPKPAIRGVQLSVGIMLFAKGIRFMTGSPLIQTLQGDMQLPGFLSTLGPLAVGLFLGTLSALVILLLMDSRKVPAALVVLGGGALAGLVLGSGQGFAGFSPSVHLPRILPYGFPGSAATFLDLAVLALTLIALPQLPMTLGNAIVSQADLTREYFGKKIAARQSFRALALSMGLANLASAAVGGMPMCHGAGGLAAHYRFGARTAGANLFIGVLLLLAAIVFGEKTLALMSLVPLPVLGALLLFAGAQLALMILDVKERKDLFVVITILGTALAANLAVAFGVGLVLAYAFRWTKLKP
jgi:SulP family sulfate permease